MGSTRAAESYTQLMLQAKINGAGELREGNVEQGRQIPPVNICKDAEHCIFNLLFMLAFSFFLMKHMNSYEDASLPKSV